MLACKMASAIHESPVRSQLYDTLRNPLTSAIVFLTALFHFITRQQGLSIRS